MSMYGETHTTVVAPVGTALAQGMLAAAATLMSAAKWVGTLRRTMEHRRALTQLGGLDEHMLRDIGLSRSDLQDAAAVPVLQDPTHLLVLRATERRAAASLVRRERGRR